MADVQQPQNLVPEDKVQEAVQNGEMQFPKGTRVDVVDPRGRSFNLPAEQAKDAFEQGFKLESARQKAVREYVKDNDNLKGTAKVALGQFADEALMGIPELIYDAKADPFDVEKKEALKKSHDIANTVGGVGGFGASMLVGGPLFKGAEVAGEAASKIVANQLAKVGLERGSQSIAKGIVSRMAENATKMGIEGAIITAPRAITEASLGDPEAAAESLMMGGGLGVGLGILSGPTGKLFEKLNGFVKAKLNGGAAEEASAFRNSFGERTIPDPLNLGDGTLVGAEKAVGASDEQLAQTEKALKKVKSNSNEIKAASDELGLPLLEEQLAADPVIRDKASALSKSDTAVGHQRSREYSERFDVYDKHLKEALGTDAPVQSAFETGEAIKQKLVSEAEAAVKPVSDIFNAAGETYETIPLNQKSMSRIADNIEDSQLARTSAGAAKGMAKRIAETLRSGTLETLDDLKRYRTSLFKDLTGVSSGNEKALVSEIAEKLLNQEDAHIDRAAEQILKRTRNAGGATVERLDSLEQSLRMMKEARAKWRGLIENFSEAADSLNIGSINSPRDFVEGVKDLTGEQIVKKFLPKNDVASLKKLAEKFPDHFQTVVGFEKAKILNDILKDGQIDPRKFITRWKKMSPELQETMFGEANKKIRAVVTDLESLPRDVNPSGTAKALSYMQNLGNKVGEKGMVAGALDFLTGNAKDVLAQHHIRQSVSIEGLFGAEKAIIRTRTLLEKVPGVIDDLYEGAKGQVSKIEPTKTVSAVVRLLEDDSKTRSDVYNELRKKLGGKNGDPGSAANEIAAATNGLNQGGAPQIAGHFTTKLSTALGYLNEQIPKPSQVETPFFKPVYKPTDAEIGQFERKLSVVMDPFIALEALKNNSLTKDHVEALRVVYPKIYQSMQNRIVNHLTESPKSFSYQQRLKLSLFMGMDTDGSLDPMTVNHYQDLYKNQPQTDENGDGLNQSGLNKMNVAQSSAIGAQRELFKK
jgi:hypothetical protein